MAGLRPYWERRREGEGRMLWGKGLLVKGWRMIQELVESCLGLL